VIGALTAYALRHRPVVLALLAVFVFAGFSAYLRLPVEAYPDVTNVQVQIITLFPGHAAEEVERLVTIPVENEMNGIPKRASMRSISLFGLSVVTIVFEDDANREYVRNQTFQHLSQVNLPPSAQASLSPDATPVGEIYRYTLHGPENYPAVELKALEDWVVERKLRTVPGVVDVVGFGGPTKQYQVLIDPAKLRSYGLSLSQVFAALGNGNRNAVQNGVILVERIRELRRSGKAMEDAIRQGAISRARPVVMTALMAALGLLPAALSNAVGAETSRPFAVVIIGGLVTATMLTLFILPILYPLFETEKPEY